jgi:hypothetical protein
MNFRGTCEECGTPSIFSNELFVVVEGQCQNPNCGYPIRLEWEDGRENGRNHPNPEEGLPVRHPKTL